MTGTALQGLDRARDFFDDVKPEDLLAQARTGRLAVGFTG